MSEHGSRNNYHADLFDLVRRGSIEENDGECRADCLRHTTKKDPESTGVWIFDHIPGIKKYGK